MEEACAALGLKSGTIAVIGGPQVYILFLKLGYDCFHLSRAVKVRLPGGLPLFGGDPDAALKAAGLKARPTQWLEDGLSLTDWVRPEVAGWAGARPGEKPMHAPLITNFRSIANCLDKSRMLMLYNSERPNSIRAPGRGKESPPLFEIVLTTTLPRGRKEDSFSLFSRP